MLVQKVLFLWQYMYIEFLKLIRLIDVKHFKLYSVPRKVGMLICVKI